MSTVSVSRDRERLHSYHVLSQAFAYPDDRFFLGFPQLSEERTSIVQEYDSLFRARSIWLYTTEYTGSGDFQKSHSLADIMGFYRAFGLQIDKERPDALCVELEFMHYLIFKALYALERLPEGSREKYELCLEAQEKFFYGHLYFGAKAISQKIISEEEGSYYRDFAYDLLGLLEQEKILLKNREREAE